MHMIFCGKLTDDHIAWLPKATRETHDRKYATSHEPDHRNQVRVTKLDPVPAVAPTRRRLDFKSVAYCMCGAKHGKRGFPGGMGQLKSGNPSIRESRYEKVLYHYVSRDHSAVSQCQNIIQVVVY